MSAGIRSGVNCTRFGCRPSTVPSVSTSRVLPRPGTPTSSTWPPDSRHDQHLVHHLLLAEDDAADLRPRRRRPRAQRLDLADQSVTHR